MPPALHILTNSVASPGLYASCHVETGSVVDSSSPMMFVGTSSSRSHCRREQWTPTVFLDDAHQDDFNPAEAVADDAAGRPSLAQLLTQLAQAEDDRRDLDPGPGIKTLIHATSKHELSDYVQRTHDEALLLRRNVESSLAESHIAELNVQDLPAVLNPVASSLLSLLKTASVARTKLKNIAMAADMLQHQAEAFADSSMQEDMRRIEADAVTKRMKAKATFKKMVGTYAKQLDPSSPKGSLLVDDAGINKVFSKEPPLRDSSQVVPNLDGIIGRAAPSPHILAVADTLGRPQILFLASSLEKPIALAFRTSDSRHHLDRYVDFL